MSDALTDPPCSADRTKSASEYRDSLPGTIRNQIIDAVTELKCSRHPYRDDHLDTAKISIEPVRSTQPRGAHLLYAGGVRQPLGGAMAACTTSSSASKQAGRVMRD
ncbi:MULTISPECIES: hypothetical protein [unclassified Streptomyces]|uniref:hypothetical protein n=1 Tax=unclassified Streptomyces TaxID=2593676 RepID=UPI00365A609C